MANCVKIVLNSLVTAVDGTGHATEKCFVKEGGTEGGGHAKSNNSLNKQGLFCISQNNDRSSKN